ncbi:hypothetical protein WK70_00500 [Burkholderia cepacia]|nr:hypothetical protein WK70_00500 [Burkholderia cepacia]
MHPLLVGDDLDTDHASWCASVQLQYIIAEYIMEHPPADIVEFQLRRPAPRTKRRTLDPVCKRDEVMDRGGRQIQTGDRDVWPATGKRERRIGPITTQHE